MNSDRKIIIYSVAAIILGLAGIYLSTIYLQPIFVPLEKINASISGKVIATQGIVDSIQTSNKSTQFITLQNNGSKIDLVNFNSQRGENELAKGELVYVTGEVSMYKGSLEITARTIKKI